MANLMYPTQQGQSLAQCMVGMMLSLLVVMAAFSAFAWMQRTQTLLQQQMDLHQMLHQATAKLRERAMRAGATARFFCPTDAVVKGFPSHRLGCGQGRAHVFADSR